MLLGRHSEQLKGWSVAYLYRSLRLLMGLRGNLSSDRLIEVVTGVSANVFCERELARFQARWLRKWPPTLRPTKAQEIGYLSDLDDTTLSTSASDDRLWFRIRSFCRSGCTGLLKWWMGCRFEGHGTNVRCMCPERPVLSTRHVLNCASMEQHFTAVAEHHRVSRAQLVHAISPEVHTRSLPEDPSELETVLEDLGAVQCHLAHLISGALGLASDPNWHLPSARTQSILTLAH